MIGVYAVMRHDLKKCYVGQSLNVEGRVKGHLEGGSSTYIREALIAPVGCAPEMFIRPCDAEDLNDAEVTLWDEMEASGWEVINRSRKRGVFGGAVMASVKGSMGTPAQIAARRVNGRLVSSRPRTTAQISASRSNGRMNIRVAQPLGASPGGRAANALRRQCLDCDVTTNPGAMGTHLKASGHSGFIDLKTGA